ncbi:hypothetical protein SDC9_207503 [bioreactor metagenome]|uniref:Uncharacterized protein n=1 Tax=bioreactor metagenome TaxID=1076179 RepID=A0A645J836_9ZZZZ
MALAAAKHDAQRVIVTSGVHASVIIAVGKIKIAEFKRCAVTDAGVGEHFVHARIKRAPVFKQYHFCLVRAAYAFKERRHLFKQRVADLEFKRLVKVRVAVGDDMQPHGV